MKKNTIGKIILASVLALLAGMAQPLAIGFAMLCVLATVLTCIFFAWAGPVPALIYTAASMFSLSALYGPAMIGVYVLLAALPSCVVISMLGKRRPFDRRLRGAVLAQLFGILTLIVVLYLTLRQDLVQALLETATNWVESLHPVLAQILLQNFAATGALGGQTAELALNGALTHEQTLEQLGVVFKNLSELLRLELPGLLLSSGLLTGVLAAALSSLICVRRGDNVDLVPFDKWFIPRQLVIGSIVGLLTGLVLVWLRVDGAEAVFNAIMTAAITLCTIGGAASIDRRFKAVGRKRGFRIAMIVLGLLFASTFIALIGALSALFGRQGLISSWIRKKQEEQDKED